eukprot:2987695-Rhodomonas_salina.1
MVPCSVYEVSSSDVAYGATLRVRYVRYRRSVWCYVHRTTCPVLRERMVLGPDPVRVGLYYLRPR